MFPSTRGPFSRPPGGSLGLVTTVDTLPVEAPDAAWSEYWIANVEAECVEVFRDPDPAAGAYRTTLTVGKPETLSSTAVPGLSLPVAALFG